MGLMQSSWALGYGLAALVNLVVLPRFGWRAVFFVGVLPALATFWIRRRVREPALWTESRAPGGPRTPMREIFVGRLGRLTIAVTLMNACTMFAWWGFNLWIPAYLSSPVEPGRTGPARRDQERAARK
jgi:MFS family permease